MNNFCLESRPKIYFGHGTISNLGFELEKYNNIMIVTGKSSAKKYGYLDQIIQSLCNKNITIFNQISPNPKLSEIDEAIKIVQDENIDYIIALGGGSVIDATKAISIGAKHESNIWDVIVNKLEITDSVKFCTITTMIATGSETNDIFVVFNQKEKLKRSLKTKYAYPDIAVMDPVYSTTINQRHTVNGIVDTFSHLFEQSINNKNNPVVDAHLYALTRELFNVAPLLINNLEDINLRSIHMQIAMYGYNGDYRSIVGGDWACHGIDYGLCSIYNSYHGEGLSFIIPAWLIFMSESNNNLRPIVDLANKAFDIDLGNDRMTVRKLADFLKESFESIGGFKSLKDIDIDYDEDIIGIMADNAMFTNPLGATYPLDITDVKKIYKIMKKY